MATAMAGPIVDGSDMDWSICTRPMSVPTMPMAGAKVPMEFRMSAPLMCRCSMCSISVSRISRMAWGSSPSMTSSRPCLKKGSPRSTAALSSARIPSRRALEAKSTKVGMRPCASRCWVKNTFLMTPNTPNTSLMG